MDAMLGFILSHIFPGNKYRKYQLDPYDKGKHLEYLTYKSLRHFESEGGKFLFNTLVPKWNGETTEVDLLLICSKGLFVFECKNYSGWIFGTETQRQWTQTLPKGRGRCHKEHFYNPIMQNASHIRHLKNLFGRDLPMRSIIVFSDRCVLKDVTVYSDDIAIIKHGIIASAVRSICKQMQDVYTEAEIKAIYNALHPYRK
jgi:hypothetical protein